MRKIQEKYRKEDSILRVNSGQERGKNETPEDHWKKSVKMERNS